VADAVEDWPATIDFERPNNVRMMPDDDVRAAVDRQASFSLILWRRFAHVGNAPVMRHDQSINVRPNRLDVGRKQIRRIHCTARPRRRGGTTTIPVVAEHSDSP